MIYLRSHISPGEFANSQGGNIFKIFGMGSTVFDFESRAVQIFADVDSEGAEPKCCFSGGGIFDFIAI